MSDLERLMDHLADHGHLVALPSRRRQRWYRVTYGVRGAVHTWWRRHMATAPTQETEDRA